MNVATSLYITDCRDNDQWNGFLSYYSKIYVALLIKTETGYCIFDGDESANEVKQCNYEASKIGKENIKHDSRCYVKYKQEKVTVGADQSNQSFIAGPVL